MLDLEKRQLKDITIAEFVENLTTTFIIADGWIVMIGCQAMTANVPMLYEGGK